MASKATVRGGMAVAIQKKRRSTSKLHAQFVDGGPERPLSPPLAPESHLQGR